MKKLFKGIDKRWKEYALAGCVCILFFVLVSKISFIWALVKELFSVLKPVILGFVIAYIINPMAVFFQKRLFVSVKKDSLKWVLSVVLSLIVVLLIIVVIIALLIPQIADNITSFIDNYSVYEARLQKIIGGIEDNFGGVKIISEFFDTLTSDGGLISRFGSLITENAQLIIRKTTSIGNTAMNWVIGIIFAVYFLFAKNSINAEIHKLFPLILTPLRYERMRIIFEKFNNIFSKYIVCEILDSAIVGIVNYIVMAILGLPNAMLVSFIVGITNLAPTFGPVIGAVVGGFILLLIKPASVIPFLILTLVLQTADGYVIKPKLFGNALNVPGVLILVAIIIFGKLMGVVGMLIAIPIAAIVVYFYSELFIPWLELRKDVREYKKDIERSEKKGEN